MTTPQTMASFPDVVSSVAINARYRVHVVTGIQRYAHEITNRLSNASDVQFEAVAPRTAKGALGHLWEQTILPVKARGRLLWSPSGCGPLWYPRQVVTFHDLFPLEHPEWYGRRYALWQKHMMTRLAKRSIHLIAVSEYTRSNLIRLLDCPPEKITAIPNGLTANVYRTDTSAMEAARRELQIPSKRYVLSVSSLVPRKNLKATLQAWAQIQSHLPDDVWLVLAGARADKSVYGKQECPTDIPRVHFTGYVPEELLAGLYSGASLFLFPSLAEGFGLPLLEAMACGVRCITSNNTSLPEIGGNLVRYVDPTNIQEIAQAISCELQEGASHDHPFLPAIERAKLFSWDKAASQTRQVLQSAFLGKYNDRASLSV